MTKYLRIKFIAYIAIYSTFSIIINSLTYPTIGVNDDEFFSQLVSGDYTGNRESFTHIAPASPQWFFGFIVTKFYYLAPVVSWYFIILLLTVLVSLAYVTIMLNSKNKFITFSELMMVVLSGLFLTWFVPSPTYTSAAFISGLAGIFGFVNIVLHKNQSMQIYIPSIFLCWSLSIRSESFYATLIIFLPVVILSLLKAKNYRYILITLLKISIIPFMVFSSNFIADQSTFAKTEWKLFKEFNSSRYLIQDNEIERVLSGNPISFGWSPAEYRLFDSYNFIYFDTFSGEKLENIVKKSDAKVGAISQYNSRDIINRWITNFKPYYSLIYSSLLIFIMYIIILVFTINSIRKVIEFAVIILGLNVYIGIIIVFLTANLRLPDRVVFPISFFIPAIIVLVGHIYTHNLAENIRKLHNAIYGFLSLILLIFTLLPSFTHIYQLKKNPAYTSFWSEQRKLLQSFGKDVVFVGNASQFKSVWSNPYVSDQSSSLTQVFPLGWYTFSPYWLERGKLLGVENISIGHEMLHNSRIIWLSDETTLGDVIEVISKKENVKLNYKELGSLNFDFGNYNLYQLLSESN